VDITVANAETQNQERPDAFPAQVVELLPSALRLAYGMLQNPTEAEDAVQEAVFKAWRGFGRLRDGSNVRAWFLTVVANQCRQQRRNRWWSVLKRNELPDAPDLAAQLPYEDVAELRQSLAALPHDQRLAIVLRYYLDLPLEEVGRVLGISVEAAKSRVHRALGKLRLELEEEWNR
jgi:RNA polymerase sigma-70 factor, ECF subfamily